MKILLSLFLSSVLSFGAVFAGMPVRSVLVSAAETETGKNAFDDTDVNEDVSAVLLSELIAEAGEDGIAVYFTEYCFAAEREKNVNYGLYVYVCNVRGYDFAAEDGKNALNMAVSYDADGNPTKYANMDLHYCGQSTGINAGLLWKFRVTDEDNEILSNALEQDRTKNERRYDIAGIQLHREGYALANDYKVGAIYRFSGYAAGYGKYVQENTLTVTKQNSDTVSLNVEHAFYRPDGNNGKEYTQDSLACVYFAVPNELIEKYGELYAVHFTYLEAVTDWMFLTGNSAVYNELLGYMGQDITGKDLQYGFGAGREYINYGQGVSSVVYDYAYNKARVSLDWDTKGYYADHTISNLKYIFPVEGGMDQTDSADDYVLQSETIREYMLAYSKGKADLILGRYSSELFSRVADEMTDKSLSAEDEFHLTGITFDNWWNEFWGMETETPYTMPAIQKAERCLSATQVESEYYIDESCYEDFKAYYDANSQGGAVYVFHFAQSDFYSAEAYNLNNDATGFFDPYETDSNARLMQETVYLDFDIIDISLKSEAGAVKVLGVVSDPIDVIANGTPALDTTSDKWAAWLKDFLQALRDSLNSVLAVVFLIIGVALIVFLWDPLTTLLGLLWKAVCTPFKAISNAVKNRKNKRE